MSLPGVRSDNELDYPNPVRDAVTTLPFHAGGSVTLAAGQVADLVYVDDLRRFENFDNVARGTHTGAADATTLTDSVAQFIKWGIQVGDEIENTTKSTSGTITALTATTIDSGVAEWDTNDAYVIHKRVSYRSARAVDIRRFSVAADEDIYVGFDRVPHATDGFDVEVARDTGYFDVNVRVVARIVVRGVSDTSTPKIRWIAWGI